MVACFMHLVGGRRQCSSGLQAIADVAAAIKAGFYTVGIGAGVEQMTTDGMSWKGSVNPKVMENQEAQDCLLPMGKLGLGSSTLNVCVLYLLLTCIAF